jgi:hypothetical protein
MHKQFNLQIKHSIFVFCELLKTYELKKSEKLYNHIKKEIIF